MWVSLFLELDLDLYTCGMVKNIHYLYMDDLEMLDSFRPIHDDLVLQYRAHSPLNFFQWRHLLAEHPDIRFKNFILEGSPSRFPIGFNRHSILESAINNMNPEVPSIVSEYLQREVSLARMIKVPPYFQHPAIHISPLGIIPKKNKPGKWRLIVDLSSPT